MLIQIYVSEFVFEFFLEYRAELYSRLETKRKKRETQENSEQLTPPKELKVKYWKCFITHL